MRNEESSAAGLWNVAFGMVASKSLSAISVMKCTTVDKHERRTLQSTGEIIEGTVRI